MNFLELIENRHSVRSYKPDPVENEKLEKILEAARLAPTACNLQPFRIFVIRTEGRQEELKKVYNKEWFVSPPYVLCICALTEKCWVRKDQKRYGDVDAAIAMDHIILAATDLGLGTCWVANFDVAAAKSFLELDASLEPIAFTPLGYEMESVVRKIRKPLDQLVIYK